MDTLLSIIIPVFNIRPYIRQCLDSITHQTYTHIEIICVDDGSTDGSDILLDEYAKTDDRIFVIHKENGGVTSARVTGVLKASGDWIGFVDGDDCIEPDMYARLLQNAKQYGAEISHCGYQMVFPDRVDYYYNTGQIMHLNSREALMELLGGVFEPGLCNKLFRRELLSRIITRGLVDVSICINEDLLMNFYLFRQAKETIFEDFCPYHYQKRKGSASSSALQLHHLTDPEKVYLTLIKETAGDPELNSHCRQLLVRHLIRAGTMKKEWYDAAIKDYIEHALLRLKEELHMIKQDVAFPCKLRYQAVLAAYSPAIYRIIHHAYGEITGINHKYDVD